MADVCYIAPASATAVVLFDLASPTGASNPQGLTTQRTNWDPGFPRKAPTLSGTTGTPGQTILTANDMGPVDGSVTMKATAASMDAYELALADLGAVLEREDLVIVRQFTGESIVRYYSIITADFDAPIGDAEGMDLVMGRQIQTSLTISFTRRPIVLTDVLDPDVNKAVNSTMLFADDTGDPIGWTLNIGAGNTYAKPNPDQDCFEVDNSSASAATTLVQEIAATPGQVWSIAADMWDWGTTVKTHMVVRFLNSSHAVLGSDTTVNAAATDWGPTTRRADVSRKSTVLTAPANTAYIRVTLTVDAAGKGRFRFVQPEISPAPTPYRVGAQVWTNDPSDRTAQGRGILAYNPGRTDARAMLKATAGASAAIVGITHAIRSGSWLPESTTAYANHAQVATAAARGTLFRCAEGTLSNTTALQTVSTATADVGGTRQVARVAYPAASGPAAMARRVRMVTTDPARLGALRGRWTAYLRCKPQGGSGAHRVLVRYAAGNVQPATADVATVVRDWTNATTYDFTDIPLGRIDMPKTGTLSGLSLEIATQRVSGSGRLDLDCIFLVPADEAVGQVVVPAATAAVSWFPPDFVEPPTYAAISDPDFTLGVLRGDGTYMVLNDTDEGFASPPISPSSGHHLVRFYTAKQSPWSGSAVFRVIDVTTAGSESIVKSVTVNTTYQPFVEVPYDSTAGHTYQYQAYLIAFDSGQLRGSRISDTSQPVVTSGESLQSDAARYELRKLDSSGNLSYRAGGRGKIALVLPPGLSWVARIAAETGLAGFQDPLSPLDRTVTDRVYVAPGYLN